MKKLAVKFEGNEIMSIDNYDIFTCYRDLWKTASEKINAIHQGIISTDGFTVNCMKLKDKFALVTQDRAIADAYGNKFIIPLDFEMLNSSAPYYQAGLRNKLCYEITFNNYNQVINSSVAAPDATYRSEYDEMVLYYDRILRHRKIIVNKSDTVWNWAFITPCKSLKSILVLFEEEKTFARDISRFYNPKIQKVSVIVEGKPNQLYAQGMRSFEQYDEAHKYFTEGKLANEVQAQLQLYDLSLGEYFINKYALWLDFRTIDENELHRMGRRKENASEGITL